MTWWEIVLIVTGYFMLGALVGPPTFAFMYGHLCAGDPFADALSEVKGGMMAAAVCLWLHTLFCLLLIGIFYIPYRLIGKPMVAVLEHVWKIR